MTEKTAAEGASGGTCGFDDVFRAELDDIGLRRRELGRADSAAHKVVGGPRVDRHLAALALSGGGIRSAAFALGVVQGLHAESQGERISTVERMDYLSTVSGGGYLGTAMTIGMSENGGQFPYSLTGQDAGETLETRHLRDNSRYLLRGGIGALLAAFVVYMRGIFLSALVLLPILLSVAAVFLFIAPDTGWLASAWWVPRWFRPLLEGYPMPLSILVLLVLGILWVGYVLAVSNGGIIDVVRRRRTAAIATWIVVSLLALIIVEAHLGLMHAIFTSVPPGARSPVHASAPAALPTWIASVVAWLSPAVLAILPFVQKLGEKAAAEATGGYTAILGKLGSRALLLFAAAIVPLLIWFAMMLLVYWGTGDLGCTPNRWAICRAGAPSYAHAPDWLASLFDADAVSPYRAAVLYALAACALFALWPFLNVNANSLHQLYRDRLGYAFLQARKKEKTTSGMWVPVHPPEMASADDVQLSKIAPHLTAYHLINAAVNVPGSRFANQRGRNADFFLFSRGFIGCELTGYVPTRAAETVVDGLNIGTAMAISGAAAAPNMGMASIAPLSPTLAFLNVRLGRWVLNPRAIVELYPQYAAALAAAQARPSEVTLSPAVVALCARLGALGGNLRKAAEWTAKCWAAIDRERPSLPCSFPGPRYLLREAFAKSGVGVRRPDATTADNSYLFLTDGGHIENLGVYGLLRRRCKLIIVVDGEADPDYEFGSLVRLERFARIDLGVSIDLDWSAIGARSRLASAAGKKGPVPVDPAKGPHAALGYIRYPAVAGDTEPEAGLLLYLKASLTGDENDYVAAYKAAHPTFPQESTADQFFSEEQFEVYRALGEHIARHVARGSSPVSARLAQRAALVAEWNQLMPTMTVS